MDDTKTTQVTGEQRTRSGAASLFSAAPGYPSLRPESAGVPTGVEREGSGRRFVTPAEGVTLIHGECLFEMRTLRHESVDAIITDLPYGTTACKWDSVIPLPEMWRQYYAASRPDAPIILTAMQPFTSHLCLSNLDAFKYELIWHKTRNSHPFFANKRPLPQHENVLVFCRGQHTYNPQKVKAEIPYRINLNTAGRTNGDEGGKKWSGDSKEGTDRYPNSVVQVSNPSREAGLHPTQKPVALMEWLIRSYTNEGDLVMDSCMGSGTTGVACIRTGRKFIGIESDEIHFATAVRRISEFLL